MIVVRAPLRISFVGGGTDLPDFFRKFPGRVISTTIDKYVYVAINRTPFIPKISARYAISETVSRPRSLQHTRIRTALMDLKIKRGLEIASFASVPAKTGLGSSSSFSVALLKGLHAYLGSKVTKEQVAEEACRLEIELLREPIGKQDQYAAAFGGFNIFTFKNNGIVHVNPLFIDYRLKSDFESHLLLFFTGVTRDTSSVLSEQKTNMERKFGTLKKMSFLVDSFRKKLLKGEFKQMGEILHEAWFMKKSLAHSISNVYIDELYSVGIAQGAWGGKILGAGGGGCILFVTPPSKRLGILDAMRKVAVRHGVKEFRELPFKFVHSGAEILYNGDNIM